VIQKKRKKLTKSRMNEIDRTIIAAVELNVKEEMNATMEKINIKGSLKFFK
jgi:hypothetical protein